MQKQKQKTQFRFRVMISVQTMIISAGAFLFWFNYQYLPANAMDYEACGLYSVVCPNEVEFHDIDEQMAKIAEFKLSTAYVSQVIAVIAELEGFDNYLLQEIARCESGFVADKRGRVDPRYRGTFQINSFWNPSVSDEQADDPWFATKWTINEIREGRIWKWDASEYCWS